MDYEQLSLEEARAYAKKPRMGRGKLPLVNQNPPLTTSQVGQPPAKKSRTEDSASSGQSEELHGREHQEDLQEETGEDSFLHLRNVYRFLQHMKGDMGVCLKEFCD